MLLLSLLLIYLFLLPQIFKNVQKENTFKQTKTLPTGIKTVFLIVMENTNWKDIKGNYKSAPYINGVLTRNDVSYAQEYYNPKGISPSEANYVWLEAAEAYDMPNGSETVSFITNYDPSPSNSTSTTDHIVTYFNKANISWKAYLEGIDGKSCPLKSIKKTGYATKHNSMIFFQDVTDNNNANSKYCIDHQRPFSELNNDLKMRRTAAYNFISPNLCHNMHDTKGCDSKDRIKNGDTWLSNNLPQILTSQSYKKGVVFIVWDEDESIIDSPIGMIVISPFAKGNGYYNTIYYDHSSLVKTIIKIFGLKSFPGRSKSANDLSLLFR